MDAIQTSRYLGVGGVDGRGAPPRQHADHGHCELRSVGQEHGHAAAHRQPEPTQVELFADELGREERRGRREGGMVRSIKYSMIAGSDRVC